MGRESETASITLLRSAVEPILTAALKEDIGPRDLTSAALIPRGQAAESEIVVRREGILAGLQVAEWVFGAVEPKIRFKPMVKEGQRVYPDKAVAFLEGPARGILAGERVALNFLGRLSGIATVARMFADRIKGTSTILLDTRKTTPTLRLLEKYAVAVGGGTNHRMGLYDGILVKENHLRLLGRGQSPAGTAAPSPVEEAVALARSAGGRKSVPVEVEVTSLQEFRQALSARADLILLDNMRLSEIQEAVRLCRAAFRTSPDRPLLEVSGGVNLSNVRAIALTGVDRISVGALTHSAAWLDLSLEVLPR